MHKKFILLLLIISVFICGCGKEEIEMPTENPIVTMNIKDYGEVKIELYPEYAFNTVANFVNLVESGYYNNNYINRVQKGFVVQGGAGNENLANYSIKGEFTSNGYTKNTLTHEKGVISMARSSNPDSACGQFFVVLDDSAKASLDGLYAGFGKVIEGMEIFEKIESKEDYNYETGYESMGFLKESDYIYIEKATVDTKGYTYKVEKN